MTAAAVASTEAIRERILDARSRRTALRIAGRRGWLDAARPVVATEVLSARELAVVTQYVPAALTLAEIRQATAAHGQWLALDPFGCGDGTIGATLATASAGTLATFFGGPRDLALGVEFVTGDGVLARGGGRV